MKILTASDNVCTAEHKRKNSITLKTEYNIMSTASVKGSDGT